MSQTFKILPASRTQHTQSPAGVVSWEVPNSRHYKNFLIQMTGATNGTAINLQVQVGLIGAWVTHTAAVASGTGTYLAELELCAPPSAGGVRITMPANATAVTIAVAMSDAPSAIKRSA